MVKIRKVKIQNFRSIQSAEWFPSPHMNCFIGPGDSGKSTILDALDWCLGARRNLPITDADFYKMDVNNPISIIVSLGSLSDSLKKFETYGHFLLGIDKDGTIQDEPGKDLETILNLRLLIQEDLEPQWSLISQRATEQGLNRGLAWGDRSAIAPNRIGVYASHHLGFNRGSILNHLNAEKADASAALAKAARDARESFGDSAGENLKETLTVVTKTAKSLGVEVGSEAKAMLDAHSIKLTGGTISLHNEDGVPLRKLGTGSSRLLVAGLQNKVAREASLALIDEVEIGLEPHRIAKFLRALGSKEKSPDLQVFMTTHSPVVLRELNSSQIHIVRGGDAHNILSAGEQDSVKGTLRTAPEAFFGSKVLVCEGATEVGLIRGLDRFFAEKNKDTFSSGGGVLVDAGGVDKIYRTAKAFQSLGYDTAVLRDDDVKPKSKHEKAFLDNHGVLFKWTEDWAIEDELFDCVSESAVHDLWDLAAEFHGLDKILDHLRTAEEGPVDVDDWFDDLTEEKRLTLGEAAGLGKWFKRISYMEEAAYQIIGPDFANSNNDEMKDIVDKIRKWVGISNG